MNAPQSMLGHNRPPAAIGWQAFCWRKAQAAAWKTPPIEVVRRRCRAAEGLGLAYRDYTAVLLDRGTYLQAVAVMLPTGAEAGRAAAKLRRLHAGRALLVARPADLPAAETLAASIGPASRGVAVLPPDATTAALAEELRRYGLKPDATALIGQNQTDRRLAEAANMARFVWWATYFG